MPSTSQTAQNGLLGSSTTAGPITSDVTALDGVRISQTGTQNLAGYVRKSIDEMHRYHTSSGLNDRIMSCLLQRMGRYPSNKLAEIRKFGGSEIYPRITASKIRAARDLLMDIYLGNERPWKLEATPDPTLPPDIVEAMKTLIMSEVAAVQQQAANAEMARQQQALQPPQGVIPPEASPGTDPGSGSTAVPTSAPPEEGGAAQPQSPQPMEAEASPQAGGPVPPQPPPQPPPEPGPIAGQEPGSTQGQDPAAEHGVTEAMVRDRMYALIQEANRANKKRATKEAERATDIVDDIMIEGNFYEALGEFISDFCTFPFAVMKGPFVDMVDDVVWDANTPGMAKTIQRPRLSWERIDPYMFRWTPGARDVKDADVAERRPMSVSDFADLMDLPGFDEQGIIDCLNRFEHDGHQEWEFENPGIGLMLDAGSMSEYSNIDVILWTGRVRGQYLIDQGIDEGSDGTPVEPDRYALTSVWMCADVVLKAVVLPKRIASHPYDVASYDPIPGSVAGVGLPELTEDTQEMGAAVMRACMNNMAIASGPQIMIDKSRLLDDQDTDNMFPWKRWYSQSDPQYMNNPHKPIDFFQPQDNSQTLLALYMAITNMADEASNLPRYLMGGERVGGAGRTASGLSMLMNSSGKGIKSLATIIDQQILEHNLERTYDYVMLAFPGLLRGDEAVNVVGTKVAARKDADRMRQIEVATLTNNPQDAQILGMSGRAAVLRSIFNESGIDADDALPSEEEIAQREQQMQMQAQLQAVLAAQSGGQPPGGKPAGGASPSGPSPKKPSQDGRAVGKETDNKFRNNAK